MREVARHRETGTRPSPRGCERIAALLRLAPGSGRPPLQAWQHALLALLDLTLHGQPPQPQQLTPPPLHGSPQQQQEQPTPQQQQQEQQQQPTPQRLQQLGPRRRAAAEGPPGDSSRWGEGSCVAEALAAELWSRHGLPELGGGHLSGVSPGGGGISTAPTHSGGGGGGGSGVSAGGGPWAFGGLDALLPGLVHVGGGMHGYVSAQLAAAAVWRRHLEADPAGEGGECNLGAAGEGGSS